MTQTNIDSFACGEDPFDPPEAQPGQESGKPFPSLGLQASEVRRKVRRSLAMRANQPSTQSLLSQQTAQEYMREMQLKARYSKRYGREEQGNRQPMPIHLDQLLRPEWKRP